MVFVKSFTLNLNQLVWFQIWKKGVVFPLYVLTAILEKSTQNKLQANNMTKSFHVYMNFPINMPLRIKPFATFIVTLGVRLMCGSQRVIQFFIT